VSPLDAATATAEAGLFALGVLATGVVLGWVFRSAWLAVQDARAGAAAMSDEEFTALCDAARAGVVVDLPPELAVRVKARRAMVPESATVMRRRRSGGAL
jgi:hypothetical protein